MKIFKKSISLFLSLVMILSLLPSTTIFGSMMNMGGGAVTIPAGGGGGSTNWDQNVNSMWGYKISVWYAKLDTERSTNTNKVYKWDSKEDGDVQQLGNTIFLRRQNLKDLSNKYGVVPAFWNDDNIFKQTTLGNNYWYGYKRISTSPFTYVSTEFVSDAAKVNLQYAQSILDTYWNNRVYFSNKYIPMLINKDRSSWTDGDRALEDYLQRLYNIKNIKVC